MGISDRRAISIIIPVYNAEKYLKQCIESIIEQFFRNYEIILIDDGSTDSSGNICDSYSKKWEFIRTIHTENKGVSAARNTGIKESVGEYLLFVDSDDYIINGSLERLYKVCKDHDLDMVRGKYQVYEEAAAIFKSPIDYKKVSYLDKKMSSADYFNLAIEENKYEVVPWLGLYKRQFIVNNNLWFRENSRMEDHEFTLKCLIKQPSAMIMQIDYMFYVYRKHERSITKTYSVDIIAEIVSNCYSMIKFINEIKVDIRTSLNARKAISTLLYQATSVYGRMNKFERQRTIEIIPRELLMYSFKHSIDKYQKTKFFLFLYLRPIVDIIYFLK